MKDVNDDGTIDWLDSLDVHWKDFGTDKEEKVEMFYAKDLKPSDECVKIVEHFEGFKPHTYFDSAGHLTLGHGFTQNIKPGDTITYEESKERLLVELDKHYADAVRLHVKVKVTQQMFDALTCFTFNLGSGNLANSTLLKKLNSEDYEGAAKEFARWTYAGGRELAGLVRRRKAEAALFAGKDWEEFVV